MEFVSQIPVWLLALLIFFFRVIDVSLGTVRTIAVVHGRIWLSVVLGFLEIGVWVVAVSQVINRINESPVLVLAYASGFAAGNATGIALERLIALGSCVVRMISVDKGHAIAEALRDQGQRVTTFRGEGRDGPRTLLYATCHRRDLRTLLTTAREIDPHLFYAVERVSAASRIVPLHHHGWHGMLNGMLKRK